MHDSVNHMAFPIEKKLVVSISSSAVFEMSAADDVFKHEGDDAYRKYQLKNLHVPFEKGVAFQFIRRLLNLNKKFPEQSPVEVVVLSRNDPDTGRRFFESCKHYGLDISRGAFLCGKDPYPYIGSFNSSLFLSANEDDVRGALKEGMPAGLVLPTKAKDEPATEELRIAFDFDGVLANDEAEKTYQQGGLESFHNTETKLADTPLPAGPIQGLARKLAFWQRFEAKQQLKDPSYQPLLRVAIVTARSAPAHSRFVKTLEKWGLSATETFFMGGIEKGRVLRIFKPHLFLDDQLNHLTDIAEEIPCVHIPFGSINNLAR